MRLSGRGSAALVVAVALFGAGCSSGGGSAKVPAASAGESAAIDTTTTAPPRVAATLTGLPVEPGSIDRPAVSVKVDNSPQGRPQSGLDKADVIFEEKVEGGVTRFIAVYHSQESDLVGPIRSLRTTDPGIVSALGGVFVFSDGVAKSLGRLKGAPVSAVSEREGAGPFTYPRGKVRPWATYGKTSELRAAGGSKASKPQALFTFLGDAEAFTASGAGPATKATIDFGGRTTAGVEWDAAAKRWLRTTNGAAHTLNDGSRLAFTNVVIQKTPYRAVGYNDSSGHKVDEAVVVGSGDAVVLVDGQQVKAKWSKPSPTAPTTYTDLAGAPIKLRTGTTLVVLPPSGNAVTVV
jgi:hypothetical protein